MSYPINSWQIEPMAEFVTPNYSKRQIVAAGKVLRSQSLKVDDETIEAFRIAHNWRSAYAYPMHKIRNELRGKVRRSGGSGLTAARLKRMQSIRRKLLKGNISLYQIQDISGARAILPSMEDVQRVSEYFENGDTPHSVIRTYDYITSPKPDGYRCKHLVLKFTGAEEDAIYNRQFVEVQLRTQIQHAWATAVEAVGLVRNENLKGGEGNKDWLRFFTLMSEEAAEREFAKMEGEKPPANNDRLDELRDIDRRIKALGELESYNQAIKHTTKHAASGARFFLINFDQKSRQVSVSPYNKFFDGNAEYDSEDSPTSDSNAVLVEVDRVRDLQEAYPNYFLDVTMFVKECNISLFPKSKPLKNMDFSWLPKWNNRRPKGGR